MLCYVMLCFIILLPMMMTQLSTLLLLYSSVDYICNMLPLALHGQAVDNLEELKMQVFLGWSFDELNEWADFGDGAKDKLKELATKLKAETEEALANEEPSSIR